MTITVHGVPITEAQCGAMLTRMQAGFFKASDIVQAAIDAGVPNVPQNRNGLMRASWDTPAYRAADNLIQKQRKLGAIRSVKNGSAWEPTPQG